LRLYQAGMESNELVKTTHYRYLDYISDSVLILSPKHTIEYVNHSFLELFQLEGNELTGRSLDYLINLLQAMFIQRDFKAFQKNLQRHLQEGKRVTLPDYRLKNNMEIESELYPVENTMVVQFRDVTRRNENLKEREQLIHKLQLSENHLQEINKSKDRVLSIISHDIRSPLNSLSGFIHLLESGNLSQDELKPFLVKMKENIRHTYTLLDDILQWVRLKMDFTSEEQTENNLRFVVNESFQLFESAAEKKGIQLVNHCDDRISVVATPAVIKFIVRNLIGNAIKFTGEGGFITVTGRNRPSHIEFRVEDTGIGMDQAKIDSLFHRVTESTTGTSNEKGTGLGLFICAEFVKKMEGAIKAESIVGEGSKFIVQLPRSVK
jgi:signal transduction histidine kinase